MEWYKRISSLAANIMATPPNKVIEVSIDSYANRVIRCREDGLILYDPLPNLSDLSNVSGNFDIVLPFHEAVSKAYSLQRCDSAEAAETYFCIVSDKVPILQTLTKDTSTGWLQRLCDTIKEHPSWNIAHLSVKLQLVDCLTDKKVIKFFPCKDPNDGITPLQLAIESDNLKIIKMLLSHDAPIDELDNNRNSSLHYAANTNKKIVLMLTEISKNTINHKNSLGQTPLHVACASDKRDCVIALLEAGADVNISTESNGGGGEPGLVGNSLQQLPGKFSEEDMKYGGTPLHWASSPEVIDALVEKNCDINCLNFHRRTALHMMIMRGRFDCAVSLLSQSADTTIRDMDGNTPLRTAVQKMEANCIKALIVFNADIHELNNENQSLRHGIPTDQPQAGEVLYILHSVGVQRCGSQVLNCNSSCRAGDTFNGIQYPIVMNSTSRDRLNILLSDATLQKHNTNQGRLLCLDGGGIRGLILAVILKELEKAVKKPIIDCFDWVAGTSTGGILALALCKGVSLQECLNLYFKLKSTVFVGIRPYSSERLERILKDAFGEETTMIDIQRPRIMIAATLADRQPVDLHFFRNYSGPSHILEETHTGPWTEPEPPPLQRLWEAARATGAAPTYFNPAGSYIDGGLIANNPTLDAMTEIHEYNISLQAVGRHFEVCPLSVVLSLGTGSFPQTGNEAAIGVLQGWDRLYDFLNLALNLGSVKGIGQFINMLVDQATQADGRVVDRARAWCSSLGVSYCRLCPLLSKDVALNEIQNDKLVHMMWETRVYMHQEKENLQDLIKILKNPIKTNFNKDVIVTD